MIQRRDAVAATAGASRCLRGVRPLLDGPAVALGLALALGFSLPALAGGCGATVRASRTVDDALIALVWTPAIHDAALWVNGRYVAQLGELRGGISLSPGTHRVEIRHDDYFTQYEEITVVARERRRIVIELAPVLP